ncbi:MAG: transposase [Chloroflexota bacterium]|nr:transposase [Chloroflexota bacterium]
MPPYDPARLHRRTVRLQGYDYRQAGAYFITLCTHQRESVFGAIGADAMQPNAHGQIVAEDWEWLALRYPYVSLDAFVVMPNHLHGIILMTDPVGAIAPGGQSPSPEPPVRQARKPLGGLIGAFKTVSTKHVNEWREAPGAMLWQRNYYEHIVRNKSDLQRIRDYIAANPARWPDDAENPATFL